MKRREEMQLAQAAKRIEKRLLNRVPETPMQLFDPQSAQVRP
jgi:hypothetical protein